MVERKIDKELFEKARKYIPGGVNSPVRSFKAVGGCPVFIKKGKGSKIYGENGREYIDYCLSWGALILGHAHPGVVKSVNRAIKNGTSFGAATRLEIEFAKILTEAFPSLEQVRLTNSGTEAVMSAVRLARAYTGRKKVVKFKGGYHGGGIPEDIAEETVYLTYNSFKDLEICPRDLAAIVVEPVAGNMGVVATYHGYLDRIREICDKHKIVLIFDEVITGFRVCFGGTQTLYKLQPDITCLGKIIGGGLPVGALGGKREIMERLAPEGELIQSGTFSGNPATVSAGLAVLKYLKEINPYSILEEKMLKLCEGIGLAAQKNKMDIKLPSIGSMFSLHFSKRGITNYQNARKQDLALFSRFYHRMLEEGIYFSPSGMEANFISLAHTPEDINRTLEAAGKVFGELRRE